MFCSLFNILYILYIGSLFNSSVLAGMIVYPLFSRCASGDMSLSEKDHWLSYLGKQLSSLKKKRSGMLKKANAGADAEESGNGQEAYNLAAVISLVEKQITNCT